MPAMFDGATFDNFKTAPHGEHNPSLSLALIETQNFVAQHDHWLCLFGSPGVGKTHLCFAALHSLRKAKQQVNLIELGEMLEWIFQQSPNRQRKLEAFLRTEVLIIDNVEKIVEHPRGHQPVGASDILARILRERAENHLPTMVAMWNHPSDEFAHIEHFIDASTVVVEIISEDYRRLPASKR